MPEEGFVERVKSLAGALTRTESSTATKKGPTKGVFQVGQVELSQLTEAVAHTVYSATRAITFGDDEPAKAPAAS